MPVWCVNLGKHESHPQTSVADGLVYANPDSSSSLNLVETCPYPIPSYPSIPRPCIDSASGIPPPKPRNVKPRE